MSRIVHISPVCIAVLREGCETVLFVFTNVEASAAAAVGALGGLLGDIIIGLALFRWGVPISVAFSHLEIDTYQKIFINLRNAGCMAVNPTAR